jgi:hypothetical protein
MDACAWAQGKPITGSGIGPDMNTAMQAFAEAPRNKSGGHPDTTLEDPAISRSVWAEIVKAAEQAAAWIDPDCDPSARAFHYARVIEIPRPRWSTRDAVKPGVPVPMGLPVFIQERAWASPIWNTPVD